MPQERLKMYTKHHYIEKVQSKASCRPAPYAFIKASIAIPWTLLNLESEKFATLCNAVYILSLLLRKWINAFHLSQKVFCASHSIEAVAFQLPQTRNKQTIRVKTCPTLSRWYPALPLQIIQVKATGSQLEPPCER